jgi:hypothetical protein
LVAHLLYQDSPDKDILDVHLIRADRAGGMAAPLVDVVHACVPVIESETDDMKLFTTF